MTPTARPVPDPSLPWPIDYTTGVLEIATSESLRLAAYLCPAGKWTCGWGETSGVTPATVWDKPYADRRLCDGLTQRVARIKELCKIEPTQNELSALLSLAYNLKPRDFEQSTVLRMHNAGNTIAAANAFELFNKYTDPVTKQLRVSKGLAARRAREKALYLTPSEGAPRARIPQAVEPERPMVASKQAQGAAVSAGAGVVGLVTQLGDQLGSLSAPLKQAKDFAADIIGIPTGWVIPAIVIAASLYVLWHRVQQRRQGVA